jgi:hypothetical protein
LAIAKKTNSELKDAEDAEPKIEPFLPDQISEFKRTKPAITSRPGQKYNGDEFAH